MPTLPLAKAVIPLNPVVNPPLNEDVAVVDVARYAAADGVDVATKFPDASSDASMFAPAA